MQQNQGRRQPRKEREARRAKEQIESRLEKVEHRVLSNDPFRAWMKQNNLKQECVVLTGSEWVPQVAIGASNSFSNTICLSPNNLRIFTGAGTFSGTIPQVDIWDKFAAMYEYWMAERIELEFHPVSLDVETTTTGVQDTATYPTASSCDADAQLGTFWNPATNLVTLRNQHTAMAAKKRFKMHSGRATVKSSSVVTNSILMREEKPMLLTNGAASAREVYDQERSPCLIMIPSRTFTDRIPFGIVTYKIHYRFAGFKNPNLQNPQNMTVKQLQDELNSRLNAMTMSPR